MTPAEIKKTPLYRTLAQCVRKEDRGELARMLAMVPTSSYRVGLDAARLWDAFVWQYTPQGGEYWGNLHSRLHNAGHRCW